VIDRMAAAGAKGFVLFNRLFEPDINLESLKHSTPFNLSTVGDYKLSLRYAGMLFNKISADVCSSTGIYSGNDIAKLLLAGAGAIQTVSALYKHKPDIIGNMLNELETFMQKHNYESIADFKGLLSRDKVKDPYIYKRAQYIDLLLHSEKIFNKYPLV